MAFTTDQNAQIRDAYMKAKGTNDVSGLMKQMTDYGVDVNGLSQATGYGNQEIGSWLKAGGAPAGFGGYTAPDNNDIWKSRSGESSIVPSANTAGTSMGPGSNSQVPAGGSPYMAPQGGGQMGGQGSMQSAWGQSPWVQQTANALTNQSRQNLMQNVMPGIRSGAQSAGQYGGSRQGIAEGVAAGNAQTGLDSALASLYSNAYGQDQSASLQNKSLDNSYNLGLGNLALGNQGQMQNFYTAQRGQDLQGVTAGANIYGAGNQGNLGIGQGQYTLGQTSMNAPADSLAKYNSMITPYTGYGQSTTQTGTSGGGAQGVLGGAMAGAQIQSNLGFGNSGVNYTPQNSQLMSQYGNNTYSSNTDPMAGYSYGNRAGF